MATFAAEIRANIGRIRSLFSSGVPAQVIGVVCGSAGAQRFWQGQLDRIKKGFGAREAIAFHEDLPVNQAFGLLLLWQRLRGHLRSDDGVLVAFVFGEGSRATPLTEAECGQKPAISSFVRTGEGENRRSESTVEVALHCFAPVEDFLRRSGFRGMVVKWGDEIQIPTRNLDAPDALFAQADIVRFVSVQRMTEDLATNKDWVGVSESGLITSFIPRRTLPAMRPLAERGLLQQRDGELYGGVNLGSIAVSRALLDCLLDEFHEDVNDSNANRSNRPDLDPQFFTALLIATINDPAERQTAWAQAIDESDAIRKLASMMPDLLVRLRRALERFEVDNDRTVRAVAMDFRDQYWGDIGQHRAMFDLFDSLNRNSDEGTIARELAGVPVTRDANHNLIAGACRIGDDVVVENSVLIDAHVRTGTVRNSVLIGTQCHTMHADGAFDIDSRSVELRLEPRSGAYRVVSTEPVAAAPGERVTTVFFDDVDHLFRVHEDTPLRDRHLTYDVPIADNPMSFCEAHARVTAAEPTEIEARRSLRIAQVTSALALLANRV